MSKASTMLTGLKVVANPNQRLGSYCERIIELLQAMPKSYVYRIHMEKTARERLEMVKANPDVETLEKKLNQGQIEEVLEQSRKEIEMIKQLHVYKPWEELVEEAPTHQWTWPPHK